jgi:hypothetical protein
MAQPINNLAGQHKTTPGLSRFEQLMSVMIVIALCVAAIALCYIIWAIATE